MGISDTTAIIYILAFGAVVVLAQSIAGIMFTVRDEKRRINRRLAMLDSGLNREEVYKELVRTTAAPKMGGQRWTNIHASMETFCRQAGLTISPERLIINTLAAAGLIWLISLVLISSARTGVIVNSAISLVGSLTIAILGAWYWVSGRRRTRIKKIEEQLPLALDVVNRAVRAGHPVISALQLAAEEMSDPLGSELGLVVDETIYGFEFKEALANFAKRVGSQDCHFFAVSVGVQSETGGNLAEILEGLSTVMRSRITLGKRVHALSSEGRASAYLLSALPPGMVSLQMIIHPATYTDKFADPVFWPVVGACVAVYALGWVMIQRIVNFKY